MQGQFVWYELTTPDVEAAKKFYPRFTSWGTQRFDDDYTMFTNGGVPLGGIFRLNDEMRGQGVPPNWMPYVESSDVDETARKAASLGGTVVVAPAEIPGTGRFAVLQDPQGATFGVYKSNTASGSWDGKAVVGRMSWHELMTSDYRKAFEFYRALFGWEQVGEMDMGGGAMYLLFGKGGAQFGGMFDTPNEMAGMHPFWLVYIHVKDVAKAVATATKAGATVVRPQMDIPGGSIAILGDPQGAGFAVHQVSAPTAPASAPAATSASGSVRAGATKVVTAVKKAVKKVAKKLVKKAPKKAKKSAPKKARKSAKRPKKATKPAARRKPSKPKSRGKGRRGTKRVARKAKSRRPAKSRSRRR